MLVYAADVHPLTDIGKPMRSQARELARQLKFYLRVYGANRWEAALDCAKRCSNERHALGNRTVARKDQGRNASLADQAAQETVSQVLRHNVVRALEAGFIL
jgi:hypothetical protein